MSPSLDASRRRSGAPGSIVPLVHAAAQRRPGTRTALALLGAGAGAGVVSGAIPAVLALTAVGALLLARHPRAARPLELVAACCLLVACSPLAAAVALVVRRHDGGPALARDVRVRDDGRTYELLSFRVRDLATGDPTPPGRWLQDRSLHVLPRLVNVVQGDIPLDWGLVRLTPRAESRPRAVPDPEVPLVVHVTEVMGGVQTYLRLLLEHSPGHVRHGFVFAKESDFADDLRDRGHEVAVVAMPRTRTFVREALAARRLRRTLLAMAPDVVHLHSSQAGLVGRLAWARRGRFVVHTPHAYHYLGKSGLARLVLLTAEVLLARLFPTQVLATSPSEAARAVRDVRVPAERVTTCTNAVEMVADPAPRELEDRAPRVGLVGRVSPQKNLPMYLRTVSRLLDDPRTAAECHFVGMGHYPDDVATLHAMMQDAGVPEDGLVVHPWMPREDLLTWLDSCDVLVLTSDYESFGYALAEASARGIPVVGTDIDGIRDVVVDGVSGFLVPRGDHDAMAERVVQLLADPVEYREMSRLGHEIASRRINIRSFTDRLESYYASGRLPLAATPRRPALAEVVPSIAPPPMAGASVRLG